MSKELTIFDRGDDDSMRPISTTGRSEPSSFMTSWCVVKASTGFESAICLAISDLVLSGLQVVIIAPSDMIERLIIGKYMEFGERMRMT